MKRPVLDKNHIPIIPLPSSASSFHLVGLMLQLFATISAALATNTRDAVKPGHLIHLVAQKCMVNINHYNNFAAQEIG
jgi:hypothetical protein